jgi:hypothetical protein
MLESLIHVQPLKLRLFAAGDYIHVIAAAQAMVEDAKQAVGVRWIVHADHFTPARQRIVDISSSLMAEAKSGDCRDNAIRAPGPTQQSALFCSISKIAEQAP